MVDRERLLDWFGRGRKPQYAMAEHYGFTKIPTPAGGCCLTEAQGAARFVKLLTPQGIAHRPMIFLWHELDDSFGPGTHWLTFGRTAEDNQQIAVCVEPSDYVFKVADFPGPLAVGRPVGRRTGPPKPCPMPLRSWRLIPARLANISRRQARKLALRSIVARVSRHIKVAPLRETSLGWAEPKPEIVKKWKKKRAESQA